MTPTGYLADAVVRFRETKRLADAAISRVADAQLFRPLDPETNSMALIVKHLAGNLRSRWTDFLTTDGEKPDRGRDAEFELRPGDTREALMIAWEAGWARLFETLAGLSQADLERTVTIRGKALPVVEAINRQLVHYGYHAGQLVLLAHHYRGAAWESLSIPRRRPESA